MLFLACNDKKAFFTSADCYRYFVPIYGDLYQNLQQSLGLHLKVVTYLRLHILFSCQLKFEHLLSSLSNEAVDICKIDWPAIVPQLSHKDI